MRKIYATGFEGILDEDKPTAYISIGTGNLAGEPEIHIEMVDPEDGSTVRAWFRRDELLEAILEGGVVTP